MARGRRCGQLCAENAGKAALALFGPVPLTHDPANPLRDLAARLKGGDERALVLQLAGATEPLGGQLHSEVTYGKERERLTPWQLFDEPRARSLVAAARTALELVRRLVDLRRQK